MIKKQDSAVKLLDFICKLCRVFLWTLDEILKLFSYLAFIYLFIFVFFAFFRAAPVAYGGSQARGLIGVVAAGLRQSHSNGRSKPRLPPTPQLTATPDP